jgi:putative acetyltransferase
MNIRLAEEKDLDSILSVVETASSDEENKVIMNLAQDLSIETTRPSIKSLIAEIDNQVIGYVSYSPIFMKSASGISGYILAPLAVSPKQPIQFACVSALSKPDL